MPNCKKRSAFGNGTEIESQEKIIEDILAYLSDEDALYFKSSILKFLLDGSHDPYFYAHFYMERGTPLMFEINPYEFESIRFMHRAELGHVYKYPEIICQYPARGQKPDDPNDLIRIRQFVIDSKIAGNLDYSGITRMSLTPVKAGQQWLYFNIYQMMKIDSVFLDDSIRIDFFKPEEAAVFWVDCGKKLGPEDEVNLTIYYHSDKLLDRDTRSWIYLKSPLYWYPRYNLWEPALYKLSFQYPTDYTLLSIGDRVDSSGTSETIHTVWHSKGTSTHAIFNMGYFERYRISRDNLPAVDILKTRQGLMFRSRDIEDEIAEDILRSIAFYQRNFGEIPFTHLYVSEIPYSLGMAFPGLLNLSWNTFYETGIRGYDQIFRAHEVAHQWWGIEVGFDTYHDQWLSEAFAEFSALAYLKSVSEDDDRYMDVIKEIFENVISNRKYVLSDGQEAGPIWLGTRTSSTRTAGDYSLIIYKKGAMVLRMIQILMSDPLSGNDLPFKTMMRDYYNRYRGKRASTEDFIRVVSEHMNQDMHWFFNQWIYGTEIPEYEYGYRVTENPDGRFTLTLRVRQDQVSDTFRMPVPIEIIFDQENLPVYRDIIMIDRPVTEKAIILTDEPGELIFNADHAVLAEWQESDFEDIIE